LSLNLIIKDEAKIDILEAYHWYENERVALGDKFRLELEETFKKILASPDLYKNYNKPIRVCMVKGFPYRIFYEVESDNIVIYAVYHFKRDPENLKTRK
jgi:toxin ParE1/3/4